MQNIDYNMQNFESHPQYWGPTAVFPVYYYFLNVVYSSAKNKSFARISYYVTAQGFLQDPAI